MIANTFGHNYLQIDLPFPSDIHVQWPQKGSDPSRYQVLWLFSEPETHRIPEEKLRGRAHEFDLILTHDRRHSVYPNSVWTPFWENFVRTRPRLKQFGVSNIFSKGSGNIKTIGYDRRNELLSIRDKIRIPTNFYMSTRLPGWEAYGLPPLRDDRRECLFESMFNIAIENTIEDDYFTEKLVDNFATYTVPIYRGCMNLSEHGIDESGIIRFDTVEECLEICNKLTIEDYYSRMPAMIRNDERRRSAKRLQEVGRQRILEAYSKQQALRNEIPFIRAT